jgi:hypothetical protein
MRGLADMADDDVALDGLALDELGHLGDDAGLRIVKQAAAAAGVEADPPTVTMRPRVTAAAHQRAQAETEIGRDVGAHA